MITAMNTVFAVLILTIPFLLAATLSWAAYRSHSLRVRRDQFHLAAPMSGRVSDLEWAEHDPNSVRTRFEHHPSWPASGALGERR